MRSIVLVGLMVFASVAGADETVDGGMDRGGKMALAGGVIFSAVYMSTAIATPVIDGIGCGLGEHYTNCGRDDHTMLLIPVVGGFINAGQRSDGSTALGVMSSVIQLGGIGVMIGGLAVHRWHKPVTHGADTFAARLRASR